MQISSFTINDDKTEMDVIISDAADLKSLRFWTDATYKNFAQAIDLSDKLTGAVTENITITLADIDKEYFDGIYFLEAEDTDEVSIEITQELTKYDECIANRVKYISTCNECLAEEDTDLLNAYALLRGIEKALSARFIDQILYFKKTLDKYCKSDCVTCGKYSNVETNVSEDIIGSATLRIKLDGGDATRD